MKTDPSLPLFRAEAQQATTRQWLGDIIVKQPASFSVYAIFCFICVSLLLGFLIHGHYTKRVQVSGVLVPDRGLIRIQAPQPGVVRVRHVREGDRVAAGQTLLELSSELVLAREEGDIAARGGRHATETHRAILDTLRARQRSLADERDQNRTIALAQTQQLRRTIANIKMEIQQLTEEIGIQKERMHAAEDEYRRNKNVKDQGFISESALQKKYDELLDQRGKLASLQRQQVSLRRDLGISESEYEQLTLKSQREQNSLQRLDLELEEASVATRSGRAFLVTAPQTGMVTAILAEPGQMVANQALLTILPADAILEAHLYVPSRAVGFIEAGQQVLIRFAAFPHQKFGQYQGRVIDVARTALAPQELPVSLAGTVAADGEGMYRVRVRLASQAVQAYGKAIALTAGMRLEAHILQDRRSLIEWLLEPLYSLKGRTA
ncbi:HlyD family secretion protein [Pseudoduganella armeniaca]|uniref:Secretion protein n=1 Tax=Pseudoduganella armeniaca TaxID=2072590 RepID=A0A2R4CGX3_9BURK|nr:HlyD family efflux transporter periplasmic adaptor subunit [Pseudoduganella armeniaca]AVR98845.1 secretion protein [Pseudoduganella armeniaca]